MERRRRRGGEGTVNICSKVSINQELSQQNCVIIIWLASHKHSDHFFSNTSNHRRTDTQTHRVILHCTTAPQAHRHTDTQTQTHTRSCLQRRSEYGCRPKIGRRRGSRCVPVAPCLLVHSPPLSSGYRWSRYCLDRHTLQSCQKERTHTS